MSTAINVRRTAALATAAAAAVALSACGAGKVTQTDQKQAAIAGVNVDQGNIALRDVQVEFGTPEGYEPGANAPLRVWIANEGDQPVSLDAVVFGEGEAPAEAVALCEAGAADEPPAGESEAPAQEDTEPSPEGEETGDTSEGEDSAEGTEDQGSEGVTEEPAEEATGSGCQTQFEPIEIAPGDYVRLDGGVEGQDYLQLEGLGDNLRSGATVDLLFQFSDGENVPVNAPVGQAMEPGEREYEEHPGPGH